MPSFFQPSTINIPKDDILEIDPNTMSDNELLIVSLLFKQTSINVFRASTLDIPLSYSVYLPDPQTPHKYVEKKIYFKKNIVRRTKQDAKGHKSYCYSVISDKPEDRLGSGYFGSVVRVVKKIRLSQSGHVREHITKQRVIKIMPLREGFTLEIATKEAGNMQRLPHLKGKELTVEEDVQGNKICSYLEMKELGNEELFELIYRDIKSQYQAISLSDRILLSHNLAVALQEQIHNCNFIHRDLKPENIRVDSNMQVHIIDVGCSLEQKTQDFKLVGTLQWCAPEIYTLMPDKRNDYYSLGLIYNALWSGGIRALYSPKTITGCLAENREIVQIPSANRICDLFGVSIHHANYIVLVIKSLLLPLGERKNTEFAQHEFKLIEIERKQIYLSQESQKTLSHAIDLGFQLKTECKQLKNSPNPLHNISLLLLSRISSIRLPRDPFEEEKIIEGFLQALDVKVFLQCKSLHEVTHRILQIEEDYKEALNQLTDFQMQLTKIYESFEKSDLLPEQKKSYCNFLEPVKEELESLINKKTKHKRQHTIDDYVYITKKYQQEIVILKKTFAQIELGTSIILMGSAKIFSTRSRHLFNKLLTSHVQIEESARITLTV